MTRHVIRMARRRTAWESSTADEIIEAEFRDRHGALDLRPSVYVFDAEAAEKRARVIRLRAEHAVSLMNSPNAAGPNLDLEGVGPRPPEQSPGTTRFSYANDTHHEIVLNDEAELRSMLDAARENMADRLVPVTRDEVLDYAAERQAANDPEWVALLNEQTKREWRRLIERYRAAKSQTQ